MDVFDGKPGKLVPEKLHDALRGAFISTVTNTTLRRRMIFADREDAGQRLAKQLAAENVEADIVLAIPRGGLPLGSIVAEQIDRPLDIIVASKIAAPFNLELAIGAVSSGGSVWLNEEMIEQLEIDEVYVEDGVRVEQRNAKEKIDEYGRNDRPDIDGKRVLIVDDGVATGATVRACIQEAYESGASEVILAVPVLPADTAEELGKAVDGLVYLDAPREFGSVGQFYDEFKQLSTEEAAAYLNR